jgi:ABC-type transport system involved in Fe-S cluster assembly fused permease/ATPase subunit
MRLLFSVSLNLTWFLVVLILFYLIFQTVKYFNNEAHEVQKYDKYLKSEYTFHSLSCTCFNSVAELYYG